MISSSVAKPALPSTPACLQAAAAATAAPAVAAAARDVEEALRLSAALAHRLEEAEGESASLGAERDAWLEEAVAARLREDRLQEP